MTGRERILAASRGGEVDRKPVILWTQQSPAPRDGRADGLVASDPSEARELLAEFPDSAVIVSVLSPLGNEIQDPKGLLNLLHDDPRAGEDLLAQRIQQTNDQIEEALATGADGIAYQLAGASPEHTTPMQYGGHFLELDRDILGSASEARFNLLWVGGEEEPYLDFVIDLPAGAFSWSMVPGNPTPRAIREAREGAIAGDHRDADIFLVSAYDRAAKHLESQEALN